jgi:hypothetical protein
VRLVARVIVFCIQPENKTHTGPDLYIVILNAPLCEMNRMTLIPANEYFELDTLAVFSDLA